MLAYQFKKVNQYLNSHAKVLAFSMLILFSCISISESLINAEYAKAGVDVKIAAADFASTLQAKVNRRLNVILFMTSGLSSYLTVYHQALEPQKIQAILADLYAKTHNVRNFAIAVGYKISYIYPMKSNEKALGVDYRDIPEHWPQVKQAIAARQGVIAGPVELIQGGTGIIYRQPVYIDGAYWGLLSTVINVDSFLQDTFKNIPSDHYAFAIRLKQSGKVFFGDASLFKNRKAVISESNYPGVKWQWAVLPVAETSSRLLIATRIMGIVISLLLATLAYFFLNERKALTSQALQDSLTGLANKRQIDAKLLHALAQAKRYKHHIAVMFIDVDHFKKINDTYGHDVGDELLKVVAKKLQACIREVDTLARAGGDEFILLLDALNAPEDARLVADKILRLFKDEVTLMGHSIKVTLSVGVANNAHSKDETVKTWLKKADIALYAAKAAGRNGFQMFEDV